MASESSGTVWRLDTTASSAVAVVSALEPADLADCLIQLKLTPERDRVALYLTGGGETTPKLSVTLPADAAKALRLLALGLLHDAARLAAGERFAA